MGGRPRLGIVKVGGFGSKWNLIVRSAFRRWLICLRLVSFWLWCRLGHLFLKISQVVPQQLEKLRRLRMATTTILSQPKTDLRWRGACMLLAKKDWDAEIYDKLIVHGFYQQRLSKKTDWSLTVRRFWWWKVW